MLDQNVCYGVLTTFNQTWFLYALFDKLYISDAYSCDQNQPSIIQMLYYFCNRSLLDQSSIINYIHPDERRTSNDHFKHLDKDEDEDYDSPNSNRKNKSTRQSNQPKKIQKTYSSTSSTFADLPQIPLHALKFKAEFGDRRYAMVLLGTLDDKPIITKVYDVSKGGESYLMKEVSIYDQLHSYQGKFILRLIARADSGGNMVGYCMDLHQTIDNWTPEIKEKTKLVVTELANSSGAIQKDLLPDNFVQTSKGDILLIDMEEVDLVSDNKEINKYLKQSYRIIDSF